MLLCNTLGTGVKLSFTLLVSIGFPSRGIKGKRCLGNQIPSTIISCYGVAIQSKVTTLPKLLILKPRFCFGTNSQVNSRLDYYQILNIPQTADLTQIKSQYYTLAKKYHPDSAPGNEDKFKLINEAYTVLSSESLKKQYDAVKKRNISPQNGTEYGEKARESYSRHSQAEWAQYRRGKSYSSNQQYNANNYPNYSGYRGKGYGDPSADIFQMLRQRDQYFRRRRAPEQEKYQNDLRMFMEVMKRQEMEESIRKERKKELDKIIKQMEKQHRQYEQRIMQYSLAGRIALWIWNTVGNLTKWLLEHFGKSSK